MIDHTVSHTYAPVYGGQTGMTFQIFSTSSPEPVSIFDDGAAEEATLLFQFDPEAAPEDKDVVLHMYFGRTMLEARTLRAVACAALR